MSTCSNRELHPEGCTCITDEELDFDTMETPEPKPLDEVDLDVIIARASLPNLAALLKQGMDKGLIQPQKKYN